MPVFEYRCTSCREKFEVLHKSTLNAEEVACPNCRSQEVKKLISSFSTTSEGKSHFKGEQCGSGNCMGNENYSCGCGSGSCNINN
jgi:putative FmdB family regulatory protein